MAADLVAVDAGAGSFTGHVLHVADADFFIRFGQMFRHVALALNADGLRVSLLTDDPIAAAGRGSRCDAGAVRLCCRDLRGGRQVRAPSPHVDALGLASDARADQGV
jgi:hypothetical protein